MAGKVAEAAEKHKTYLMEARLESAETTLALSKVQAAQIELESNQA